MRCKKCGRMLGSERGRPSKSGYCSMCQNSLKLWNRK